MNNRTRIVLTSALFIALLSVAATGNSLPISGLDISEEYSLQYATYIGGDGNDQIFDIEVDSSGNIYIVGLTEGLTQLGGEVSGGKDGFLIKMSHTGVILGGMYIGGSFDDSCNQIILHQSGDIYLAGWTSSRNEGFPKNYTIGVGGHHDIYVMRLNPALQVVSSTVIGGSDDESAHIQVTLDHEVYIGGSTRSDNLPMLNALNDTFGGGAPLPYDGYIMKMASNASALLWSTYLGGSGMDILYDIEIDTTGIYVTGRTLSDDFPTVNAYDDTREYDYWGYDDCFVSKMSLSGSELIYSTYVGTEFTERAYGLVVDDEGNALVVGEAGNLETDGADCYIFKLNSTGNGLIYSIYIGGSGNEGANDVVLDRDGNAIISGTSPFDCIVFSLNPAGSEYHNLTNVYGNSFEDQPHVAVDSYNNLYVSCITQSDDLPTNASAYTEGDQDGYVVVLSSGEQIPTTTQVISTTTSTEETTTITTITTSGTVPTTTTEPTTTKTTPETPTTEYVPFPIEYLLIGGVAAVIVVVLLVLIQEAVIHTSFEKRRMP